MNPQSEVNIPLKEVTLENGVSDPTLEERTPSHNEDSENNKQNVGICGLKFSKMAIFKMGSAIMFVLLVISVGFNIYLGRKSCRITEEEVPSAKIKQLEDVSTPKPFPPTSCLPGWILNENSCFFFSVSESTWHASLRNCSSYGASLFVMATRQEMVFINQNKAPAEYWMGLKRKKIGEPWTQPDGAEFDVWFEIKGEGLCATLNDGVVSSTYCDSHRHWICRRILHAV